MGIKRGFDRFSATAGEALSEGDIVALKDADGEAYKADANDTTLRPAVGIVGKGGSADDKVEIWIRAIADGYSSLAEGGAVYLSETAGDETQTAPDWAQKIGAAIDDDRILFDFSAAGRFVPEARTFCATMPRATGWTKDGADKALDMPALAFPVDVKVVRAYAAVGTAPGSEKTLTIKVNTSEVAEIAGTATTGDDEDLDIDITAGTAVAVTAAETASGSAANLDLILVLRTQE